VRKYRLFVQRSPIREYPSGDKVRLGVQDTINWINAELEKGEMHPIKLAAKAYQRLVTLHPYPDGNGRTTRLIMDAILMRGGYPPAIFSGYTLYTTPEGETFDVNDYDVALYGLLSDNANVPPGFAEVSVAEAVGTSVRLLSQQKTPHQ
jgi:hypothetical protein